MYLERATHLLLACSTILDASWPSLQSFAHTFTNAMAPQRAGAMKAWRHKMTRFSLTTALTIRLDSCVRVALLLGSQRQLPKTILQIDDLEANNGSEGSEKVLLQLSSLFERLIDGHYLGATEVARLRELEVELDAMKKPKDDKKKKPKEDKKKAKEDKKKEKAKGKMTREEELTELRKTALKTEIRSLLDPWWTSVIASRAAFTTFFEPDINDKGSVFNFMLVGVPACMPAFACMCACLPACLPACVHAVCCVPAFVLPVWLACWCHHTPYN